MRRRSSYRAIDREETPPGNPIDLTIHRRFGEARADRELARATQAVVDALGRRRRVWFDYEDLLSRITDRRQAACFDMGVEHGIAAARASQLPGASRSARAIAAHVVRGGRQDVRRVAPSRPELAPPEELRHFHKSGIATEAKVPVVLLRSRTLGRSRFVPIR